MRRRHVFVVSTTLVSAIIAGCAGVPFLSPGPPTVASEQRRLSHELRDAPVVVVETTPEGRLRVAVPLRYCFDAGRGVVKPPLAAVLDRMAPGLKPGGFDVRVAAPADTRGGGTLLAQDRAASVRDYLVARGVPVLRFAGLAQAAGDHVELLLTQRPGH
jgi:outer membrane protein OmpA-like peptidoglycan-associated protein